jgi:hypothetical protein
MIVLPASLDMYSRGEFWRYLGQTFQLCIEVGMTPDNARQFAIQYINEKARDYEIQNQHA